MELVSEIIKSCESLSAIVQNHINNFKDNMVAISEFNSILDIINSIKMSVNENNSEVMRNALIEVQSRIDEVYLKVNKMKTRM